MLLFCVKFMCQFLFVFYIFISLGRPKQIKIINKDKKFMYIFTTGTGLDYMVYKDTTLNVTNDVINGMNAKMKSLVK